VTSAVIGGAVIGLLVIGASGRASPACDSRPGAPAGFWGCRPASQRADSPGQRCHRPWLWAGRWPAWSWVAVASLISNAGAAPAVAQFVLFPLLFLSGTYMPIHSQLLIRITGWLPVRPFNEALTGPLARHTGADWRHLAVLAAWGAAGAAVAVRRFRWDPRPE
jgi:hypothetical protein